MTARSGCNVCSVAGKGIAVPLLLNENRKLRLWRRFWKAMLSAYQKIFRPSPQPQGPRPSGLVVRRREGLRTEGRVAAPCCRAGVSIRARDSSNGVRPSKSGNPHERVLMGSRRRGDGHDPRGGRFLGDRTPVVQTGSPGLLPGTCRLRPPVRVNRARQRQRPGARLVRVGGVSGADGHPRPRLVAHCGRPAARGPGPAPGRPRGRALRRPRSRRERARRPDHDPEIRAGYARPSRTPARSPPISCAGCISPSGRFSRWSAFSSSAGWEPAWRASRRRARSVK